MNDSMMMMMMSWAILVQRVSDDYWEALVGILPAETHPWMPAVRCQRHCAVEGCYSPRANGETSWLVGWFVRCEQHHQHQNTPRSIKPQQRNELHCHVNEIWMDWSTHGSPHFLFHEDYLGALCETTGGGLCFALLAAPLHLSCREKWEKWVHFFSRKKRMSHVLIEL